MGHLLVFRVYIGNCSDRIMAFIVLLLKLAAFIGLVVLADRKLRVHLSEPVSPRMRALVWVLCLPLPVSLFAIAAYMPEVSGKLSWGVVPALLALFSAVLGASLASHLSKTRDVYFFVGIIAMMLFVCMVVLLLLYDLLVVHHTVI